MNQHSNIFLPVDNASPSFLIACFACERSRHAKTKNPRRHPGATHWCYASTPVVVQLSSRGSVLVSPRAFRWTSEAWEIMGDQLSSHREHVRSPRERLSVNQPRARVVRPRGCRVGSGRRLTNFRSASAALPASGPYTSLEGCNAGCNAK
jgi:hypothetical protein